MTLLSAPLSGCDIRYTKPARLDIATAKNLPIELVFLPAADISMYVADGCVDLGITGQVRTVLERCV